MFEGAKSVRFFIKVESLLLLKTLISEHNIPIKNEIEVFTNTNSLIFYALKKDFSKIDAICVANNIDILDQLTPHYNYNLKKISKSLIIILSIMLFIIILLFIFQ